MQAEWVIVNENFKKMENSISNLLTEIEALKKDHLKILAEKQPLKKII